MGRFRKRKSRVVWLPNEANSGQPPTVNYRTDTFTVPAAPNVPATTVYALTVDYPAEAIQSLGPQPPSVADYVQSGFRIERIVGKFVAGVGQLQGDGMAANFPSSIAIGMGLIVLRVDELTGAPLRAATPTQYSVFADDNERDPFFFRRTWVLANDIGFGVTTTALDPLSNAPRCNSDYGSGAEGTYVDTQTRRLVKTEERVFLVVDAVNIGNQADSVGTGRFYFDYRILVTPRVMSNRNNASR